MKVVFERVSVNTDRHISFYNEPTILYDIVSPVWLLPNGYSYWYFKDYLRGVLNEGNIR